MKQASCISYVSRSASGHPSCIYLTDGQKITLERKGAHCYMKISQQGTIKLMQPTEPTEPAQQSYMNDDVVLYHAISMWANYIETGDVIVGAEDAVRIGKKAKIKSLNNHQKEFVERLRVLSGKALNGHINIKKY